MGILQDCMTGLVFCSAQFPQDRVIDFLIANDERIVLLYSGWWAIDWDIDNGIEIINGEIAPGGLGYNLTCPNGSTGVFIPPETPEQSLRISRARDLIDVDRENYLKALQLLRDNLGSDWYKQCDEWIALVESRPVIDPVGARIKRNTGLRTIGAVTVTGQDDKTVDALVIDDLGNVATLIDGGWLESIGTSWFNFSAEDRPTIEEFMGWVKTQRPGGLNLTEPKIFQTDGSVEMIAINQVSR